MSGTFPASPKPSSVQLSSKRPTLLDMTQSGKRNVRQFGSQQWTLQLGFPNTLSRDQMMPIYAFLLSLLSQCCPMLLANVIRFVYTLLVF